jgi:hypothetical protein
MHAQNDNMADECTDVTLSSATDAFKADGSFDHLVCALISPAKARQALPASSFYAFERLTH